MRKKRFLTLLFLLIAAPVLAGEDRTEIASIDRKSVGPELKKFIPPAVTERYEYYEITGAHEQELRDQLSKKGIKWDDGKRYDSVTRWRMWWEYGEGGAREACSPDSFRVHLEITYLLPRWTGMDRAAGQLEEKWNSYMQNMVRHEQGHRDIAKDAAAAFYRTAARLPLDLACAERDRELKALSLEMLAQLNSDQYEYDCATGHGVTQGAVFP